MKRRNMVAQALSKRPPMQVQFAIVDCCPVRLDSRINEVFRFSSLGGDDIPYAIRIALQREERAGARS